MKVKRIIEMLQEYSTPEEQIMVQWWTKKDVESSMGDIEITPEVWTDAVAVWNDEPLEAREAGVFGCVMVAQNVVKERKKKETAAKFKLIVSGEFNG